MNPGLSSSTLGTPLLEGCQSAPAPVLVTPGATEQAA